MNARSCAIALLFVMTAAGQGPNFTSGSTGADGALTFTCTTATTVVFDPAQLQPALDPERDNIYHFTTINIPACMTVKLSGRVLSGPVYWLATGAVTISGFIDLTGENGPVRTQVVSGRMIAFPGAGGFAGGIGGRTFGGTTIPATAGSGPGGGAAGTTPNGNGGGGAFTGNTFLVPLIGGSGGGSGLAFDANVFSGGGGAGGGAILIASSTSIALSGAIFANGGVADCYGGNGAGGAIRLVAPTMTGGGQLQALGASGGCGVAGQNGRVRVETANYAAGFSFLVTPHTITATPNIFLPTVIPGTIRAISVNGVNLPATPTGSFATPDSTINTTSAVNVVIQAANIPLGTVVKLQVFSDTGADITVNSSALAGTLANSTATASVTFPSGFSRGYVKATW